MKRTITPTSPESLWNRITPRTRQCEFPQCQTLVLGNRYCAKHRPQGEWAIAEALRHELAQPVSPEEEQ